MDIEPPSIPPALGYKELATVVQATTKDIGKAVELLEAAQQACKQTPAPEPKVTVENLGELSLYRHRLESNYAENNYPREGDNPTMLSRLDRLTTLVEGLTVQVSDLKKTVDTLASVPGKVEELKKTVDTLVSVPEKVEDLSNNFGTFAIPIVQRHNAGCATGKDFQRVPFPGGTWPNAQETNQLESLDSINDLTVEQLKSYCRKYGLEVGGRKADICQRLCVHLGVGRIAEQKSRD